jgi:hypothetical protein
MKKNTKIALGVGAAVGVGVLAYFLWPKPAAATSTTVSALQPGHTYQITIPTTAGAPPDVATAQAMFDAIAASMVLPAGSIQVLGVSATSAGHRHDREEHLAPSDSAECGDVE